MKSIKLEIVRTITSTETYIVKMSDIAASKFLAEAPSKTKEELAEIAEDMFQKAQRKPETMNGTSKDVNDNIEKVNYARYRDCTGDN